MFAAVKICMWMLVFYCVLYIAVFLMEWAAPSRNNIYFSRDYERSIYANEVDLAIYSGIPTRLTGKQVFILGASVPGFAFLPDRIIPALHGYQVNNLCLPAANITEMEQVVDLLESRVRVTELDRPIFVIGGHFMSFLDNAREFGGTLTTVQQEFIRYGLYRAEGNVISPRWDGAGMTASLEALLKPFMLIDKIKILVQEVFKNWIKMYFMRPVKPNAAMYRGYRETAFVWRGFTEDEFAALNKLINRLRSEGAEVIFVQMPVPSYYRKGFAIYDEYRQRTNYILRKENVAVLDMSDWAPDDDFNDDAHPVDTARNVWSDWLGRFLAEDAIAGVKQRWVSMPEKTPILNNPSRASSQSLARTMKKSTS